MRFALLMIAAFATAAVAESKAKAEPDAQRPAAQLAAERCGSCHGPDGRGVTSEYPSLAGQHAEYLSKQIFNFKTGQRSSPVMQPVVENLTAGEIRALTNHFSAQKTSPARTTDATVVKLGENLYRRGNPTLGVAACASCHGERASGSALMPRLAGQNAIYLENQLRGFINKARTNDNNMHAGLTALTEAQIRAVALYLSTQE
jgi:cytochrome c553